METLRLAVDVRDLKSEASQKALQRAAAILRAGGAVAFPTETVYGLGANALDASAVEKIFAAKQRPSWDPLIVHISDTAMLQQVTASLPANASRLIDAFWPGPLTLLLPKSDAVPTIVTAGRERVGVRMPVHPVALALMQAAGVPIAAPSANSFGRTSPTTAEHVAEDLEGRIDAILDAGETAHGVESSVLDACEDPCVLYRPGVISLERIQAAGIPAIAYREPVKVVEAKIESLPSPGVGLRHYAPRAKLILIDGTGETQRTAFNEAVLQARGTGAKTGLMLPDAFESTAFEKAVIYRWGAWRDHEELARRLFAGLRYLDKAGVAIIVCPLPPAQGIGIAIRDRLVKAARTE